MDRSRIEQCVARLAEDGCKAVWGHIEALEGEGEPPVPARGLSAEERRAVAAELRAVMAVYAERCEPE